MLLRQPLDRMPHTEKYAPCKPVMLVRIQNPLQQETKSCKQSTSVSRMRWHLSEPYQQTCTGLQWGRPTDPTVEPPNNTAIFSPRTRSQDMFALVCHGKLSQYCCMWFAPRFFVFIFSFVIVLVFVTKIALAQCAGVDIGGRRPKYALRARVNWQCWPRQFSTTFL